MRAKITIDLGKLKENFSHVNNQSMQHGVTIAAVTKAHCADERITSALASAGAKIFADSRIENLQKIRSIPGEKWLIRIPAPSIANEVVEFADLSLNSEIITIRLLELAASRRKKAHKVILMWDVGDLREGYADRREIVETALEIGQMKYIRFSGIGTNLNCFGAIDPTQENMEELVEVASEIEESGLACPIISGGNSTSYSLMLSEGLPAAINNLRVGDTIYLGRDRLQFQSFEGMHDDVFVLSAEVVELKQKPSVPRGRVGTAALGEKPVFTDRGIRKRAIVSFGKQDTDLDMIPIDEGAIILGGSSDHIIVDVSDCSRDIRLGDWISFKMGYAPLLRAFTSDYIDKVYIDG